MFRRLTGINIVCQDTGKVWDTYTRLLGFRAMPNKQVFDKGRYYQQTLRIGEVALWLLQPMDPPEAPGPGGGMARFLRRHGEGVYMITVRLGDEAAQYARRLESKGIKVYWDVPDGGLEVLGAPRAATQMTIHPLIHPRSVHGVLWEMRRHMPGAEWRRAPSGNPFKRAMAINIVVKDADAAARTYHEALELDPLLGSAAYEKAGYKETTIPMGEVVLEFQEPLHSPDAHTRGGSLARTLQQFGEDLYSVTVDVKDPAKYARELEARGVKVQRTPVDNGRTLSGHSKPKLAEDTILYTMDPSCTHGVPWEFRRFGSYISNIE